MSLPLSIAIALFLTEIAPRRVAAPIATMVELLAAIPSVVLGLWGILVFGPWVRDHLEPWLKDVVTSRDWIPWAIEVLIVAGVLLAGFLQNRWSAQAQKGASRP